MFKSKLASLFSYMGEVEQACRGIDVAICLASVFSEAVVKAGS
jgi:hypothetical protein